MDWDRHDDAQDHFCEIDGEWEGSLEGSVCTAGLVVVVSRWKHRRVDG